MSWIDQNPYEVATMMAGILFFARFWPIWEIEKQIRAKNRQIAKKCVDIECETPQNWFVFTDKTLYPGDDIDKSLFTVIAESSPLLGSCWSYNGNFVIGFYHTRRRVRW